jgi:hypothetical protein
MICRGQVENDGSQNLRNIIFAASEIIQTIIGLGNTRNTLTPMLTFIQCVELVFTYLLQNKKCQDDKQFTRG